MMEDVTRQVEALYSTPDAQRYFAKDGAAVGMDASLSGAADRLFAELIKKYERMFGKASRLLAQRMVEQAGKESAVQLSRSIEKLAGGLTLKTNIMNSDLRETFKSTINANADLIVSIQRQYIDEVKSGVYRSIASGNGLADLQPFLQKRFDLTDRKAKNLALDQTRKAFNDINADRMRAVGMTKFEWIHSGGGHKPRPYHFDDFPAGLNGGIFDINDPPIVDEKTGERGLPGHAINCKCTMRPILEFGEE